jgi:LysR family transcriptional activator of nhaA
MYFWAVVRNGSLYKACEELHLAAPTVSTQLRTFEERIGVKLLEKNGRRLVPTEAGKLVFSYAEEIFALGTDLLSALAHRPTRKPLRVAVGVDDVVPKELAHRLVGVALTLAQPIRLVCKEGTFEQLLTALQLRELDVILTDAPVTPSLNMRAYNHHLGSCSVVWMAAPALVKTLRAGFPKSLNGAPMLLPTADTAIRRSLLPTADTAIRRSLDQWLDRQNVQPVILGEFEDYALLWEFARSGRGIAPVPAVVAAELSGRSGLKLLGPAKNVQAQFYAISMERKIVHPAVVPIYETARQLFAA